MHGFGAEVHDYLRAYTRGGRAHVDLFGGAHVFAAAGHVAGGNGLVEPQHLLGVCVVVPRGQTLVDVH